jgi:hypothetical protein
VAGSCWKLDPPSNAKLFTGRNSEGETHEQDALVVVYHYGRRLHNRKGEAMSHYMTALAMKQEGLKPAAKIVLYWLADHHNGQTGMCFPSPSRLCRLAEMGKTSLVGHLDTLEAMGLIERSKVKRDTGAWSSTSYLLHLAEPLVWKTDNPCSENEHALVRKSNTNLGTNNLGNEQVSNIDHFSDFWAAYPRKIGKGNARKAFEKAMKSATIDEISSGLNSQLDILKSKEQKFIPHAATWLNGERWNDEPDHNKENNSRSHATLDAIAIAARASRSPSEDCF